MYYGKNLLFFIFLFSIVIGTLGVTAQTTVTSRIVQASDDAEELFSDGSIDLNSSDLELGSDGGDVQIIGMRFQNIEIPQGTTILDAYIQFTVDETDSGPTSVTLFGQDIDNAPAFTGSPGNISGRTSTTASVTWNNIPAWNTVGAAGADQRTPDLTPIVQEIVNRGGWNAGNAMVFGISGSGERTAESYNGFPAQAPRLTIVTDIPPDPMPTIVSNPNRGLPFIYFMADNRAELYSVAPDPSATPLPSPTITNLTLGGNPAIFSGEGGGYRSTDNMVYVFEGEDPADSSDLYRIDPDTGVATLIKTDIVPGHVDGAEFWINNTTGQEVFFILHQDRRSGGPHRITAVNPNANGPIPAWTAYDGYPVVLSGAVTQADGISWNPDTAEFYVQNDGNVDYYTVDITTGVTSLAFSTSFPINGEGITYASDGTNYIEDENVAGLGRTIFIVDTDTGDLTPAAQLGSTGDVEYIMGNLGVRSDAGDAPSSYGYAAHFLPVLNANPASVYMGSTLPDSEDPFVNFSNGSSDDNTGDDEDGVTSGGTDLSGQLLTLGTSKTIDIVTNGSGVLNAWIDFNRDGDFEDLGEQVANDVAPSGNQISLNVNVPGTSIIGTTYARFRYSSESGLSPGNSEASDGEVEDYQVILHDNTTCPPDAILVGTTSYQHVHATSVIVDDSVSDEDDALGNDPDTTARLDNNDDVLVLEMGQGISSGDAVTVYGEDGDDFNIWVSASATGPWTQVGFNAQLDYTFNSPIDWQYIRFQRGDSFGTEDLAYIVAKKSIVSYSCAPDNDGDGIADRIDLDDDNDGLTDCDESSENVNTNFAWTLNNPTGNVNMDYVESASINDWVLASTGTLSTSGISANTTGSNVQITNIPAANLSQAIDNGDYIEVSFTTGTEVSSLNLNNIWSGWWMPSEGDSFYSGTQYSEGNSGVWVTLSEDVYHTDGGSTYAIMQHMDGFAKALSANTLYTFRFYIYGQIDDSPQAYSIFDDIYFNVSACRAGDSDGDGRTDFLDLDSDNDGIYDAVEAGHDRSHTNGTVNGPYGVNGLADAVETASESGILNYTILNTDGADPDNYRDADSDGDGCGDADEAYADAATDSDDNGRYGGGNPGVNADGTVVAASYQAPADGDNNGTDDYKEAGGTTTISDQPADEEVEIGGDASFSVTASGSSLRYQWQVSTDGGVTYSNISGETGANLTITGVTSAQNWNLYRVYITDASYTCSEVTSDAARLMVTPDSDGDGILDTTDLDDDNDGIPDSIESPNTILWVTDGTAAVEEQRTIDKLTDLGWVVTVVDDGVGGNANDYAVTFIYEDANSGTALANVANMVTTERGVLTSETFLHDDLLGANQGATNTTAILNITDNTHPVTSGLPLGNYDIGDASFRANSLVSGTHLGFHPNGQVSLAVWETGDALDMGTAPGRRAIVPHSNSNGGFNAAGENLLINAILWTAAIDTDGDGVNDHMDLDSDNDGIYDAVEAGHDRNHTNGVVNGTYGANGLADVVEISSESGTINYSITNTDGTNSPDFQDTDSDDDGCSDANEAYSDANADGGDNEFYTTGDPPATDSQGRVTAAAYPEPADGDGNSTFDYREASNAPSIGTQPVDTTICPGCTGTLSVVASDADTYQWQSFDGSAWVDLTDSGIHSGSTTEVLTISNPTPAENGDQYRVIVSSSSYVCTVETSDTATLTVAVNTVITNRRITYRVKKN